jgi:hypothetical protein
MKLKKFGQFSKVNEDINPTNKNLGEFDSMEKELGDESGGEPGDESGDESGEEPGDDIENQEEFGDDTIEDEFEDDEPYEGESMMRQLADKLGVEVINNEIKFDGHTINFFSETRKLHIGEQKFRSVEEVLDFLKPNRLYDDVDDNRENEWKGESMRHIRKFK